MLKKIIVSLVVVIVLSAAGFLYYKGSVKIDQPVKIYSTPGVTDQEIVIGSSSALSGHAGQLGTNYLHGAMSRINDINEEGGINGRKIKAIAYDDQYDPEKTIENTQKLINEDRVFALFNYVGTPTAVKIIPIVEEAKIPLVGLFTGANALRDPFRTYIFNTRPSYYQETELAVKYFVDNLKLSKIAVFYQADAYGADGLEGAKIALQKRGLSPVSLGSYERGTLNVEEAVQVIINSKAEAVIMVGTYSPTAKFVSLVKAKNSKTFFHSVSFVGPEEFAKELGVNQENVFVTQVVPPLYNELFDSVEKYQKNLAKYYPGEKPSFGGLEGYVNAKVLAEGLRRTAEPITRPGFIRAMESIKEYSTGTGGAMSFSENNHQGIDKVFLTSLKNDEFILVTVQ